MRERFQAQGQGHVFAFWDQLDARQRESLVAQCAAIDLPALLEVLAAHRRRGEQAPRRLAPAPVECCPAHGGDPARFAAAQARGEELLRQGRVALLVVAGGQATRLGYPGPKGCYPLGPVTQRSLFELQAQKIRRLRERSGCALPWYVMTSPATDGATRAFFRERDYFGLPPEDVAFFCQGMVPSFDFEDRLVLAEPGRLLENPDGHGGCLTALLRSGALDEMERRGIHTIFYYQVDNPLVRMADAAFLGFHHRAGAEVSCKVVRKLDPMEKVGILARTEAGIGVVEYTELEDEHRYAEGADGDLLYWAGNIAVHLFETAFVRRVASEADRWLPFHASAKKLPTLDASGRAVPPSEPNGYKLERFIFDALPAAKEVCLVETLREQEFSPVKNAEGDDSPATARRDLSGQAAGWLAQADLEVPPGAVVELDHARIDSAEDARALGIRNLTDAGDIVRIESGAQA